MNDSGTVDTVRLTHAVFCPSNQLMQVPMRLFLLALLLLITAPHATAQFVTPEEVLNESADAINREDFLRAARTMHPEALEELRQAFVNLEELLGPEDLGLLPEGDSFTFKTPEEVYEVAWMILLMDVPEGTTLQTRFDYLGYVEEGDQVHAVARAHTTVGSFESSSLEVITMKQHEDGWRAMLSGDIESLVQMLRSYVPTE